MSVLENFHFQKIGPSEAPKLVFLHGLMGSLANWRKITTSFSKDFEILIFDQRGHGRSQKPASGYQPQDYAQDLSDMMDELGWEKIDLVGHSMGGRNALMFAHVFPHRINRLVLEDISPEADPRAVERIEFLLSVVPVPFQSRAEAKEFFTEEFAQKLKGLPKAQDLGNYFFTNIEEKPDGTAHWRFSLEGIMESLYSGRAQHYWKELKGLKCPTLIIRGGRSNDLSQEVFEKMLQANSHIQGVVIEDAGHWVHFDQSEAFTEALRSFLKPEL